MTMRLGRTLRRDHGVSRYCTEAEAFEVYRLAVGAGLPAARTRWVLRDDELPGATVFHVPDAVDAEDER
ncbi:MAG: hypothetical protein QOC58_1496 [Mycobacterium sp.]|jgi:hypothetical protein|nr:hypothetical protein [Mycobacterium sp.]